MVVKMFIVVFWVITTCGQVVHDSGLHSIGSIKKNNNNKGNSTYIAYVIHNTIQKIVKTHVTDGPILPIVPFDRFLILLLLTPFKIVILTINFTNVIILILV
jgi:hypothetical protein